MPKLTEHNRNESFKKVKPDKIIRQKLIVDTLNQHFQDGAGARELAEYLYSEGLTVSPERNQVHPRLNELVKAGLVSVSGRRLDTTTNRSVAVYKANDVWKDSEK